MHTVPPDPPGNLHTCIHTQMHTVPPDPPGNIVATNPDIWYIVEPLNDGQVSASTIVHYSEVVLYWGVLVKKPYICSHIDIPYFLEQ